MRTRTLLHLHKTKRYRPFTMLNRFIPPCIVLLLFLAGSLQAQQNDALTYYVEAVNLRKAAQFQKAIAKYELAILQEPENVNFIYEKAHCEFQAKQGGLALQTLHQVVKLKQDFVPAYVLMARISQSGNQDAKVVEYYEKAARFEKDVIRKADYLTLSMRRLLQNRDVKGAYRQAKDIYELVPSDTAAAYNYARLSNALDKSAEARAVMTKLVEKLAHYRPEAKAKYYYELGLACYKAKDFAAANQYFAQASHGPYRNKAERFSAKYFSTVALAYFRLYEDSLTLTYVAKAHEVEKGYAAAHLVNVQLSKRRNGQTEALPHLIKIADLEQNKTKKQEALYDVAELQLLLGKWEECMATADRIYGLDNRDFQALFVKNLALYRQGKYKELMPIIQKQLKMSMSQPLNAQFNFMLGMAARKSGSTAVAQAAFKAALPSSLGNAAQAELTTLNSTEDDWIDDITVKKDL
jgi:hypothetical protein